MNQTEQEIEKLAEQLAGHLLTSSDLEHIAIDAVPRQIEAVIFSTAVHVAAAVDAIVGVVGMYAPAGQLPPDLKAVDTFLFELQEILTPIVTPSMMAPAGSNVLRALPKLIEAVNTLMTAEGITGATISQSAVRLKAS